MTNNAQPFVGHFCDYSNLFLWLIERVFFSCRTEVLREYAGFIVQRDRRNYAY